MAQLCQQLCSRLDRFRAIRMDRRLHRRARREGDPQLAGLRANFGQERAVQRRSPVRVADIWSRCRVQQRGAVPHGQGKAVLDDQAVHHVARVRSQRVAAARGLESNQPAAGRRNPDRPAPIAGMRQGHNPSRDRRGGTAAGSARSPLEVPRIAGRPERMRLRGGRQAQFRRVGLPDADQAGPFVAGNDLAVVIGRHLAQQSCAVRSRDARVGRPNVLEQIGDSAKRTLGRPSLGCLAGQLEHRSIDRVEVGLRSLDRGDRDVDEFQRLRLTLANQFRQSDGVAVEFGDR